MALLAAPTAIAAEVPQTDVAVATVMTKGLLSIFSTLVPNDNGGNDILGFLLEIFHLFAITHYFTHIFILSFLTA